ncbi:hypothetical protein BST81_16495 [Leptolyngbya sp. 'hensonii']|nr:hypothetical protein BST81_16495 [Leptolyngbya sp. 'hensonii']
MGRTLWQKVLQGLWISCLICLLAAPMAWAQVSSNDGVVPPESPPSSLRSFDSNGIAPEKISQFVRAYLQVLELIERREGDLQASETDLESLRIQQDIEAEAYGIIEQAGLTRQEYLQLLSLANTDPEFGERIATQLQEGTD